MLRTTTINKFEHICMKYPIKYVILTTSFQTFNKQLLSMIKDELDGTITSQCTQLIESTEWTVTDPVLSKHRVVTDTIISGKFGFHINPSYLGYYSNRFV